MKLDVSVLRYMSREEFRVLTAVEMGMKNHEIVPTTLICRISNMKRGLAFKALKLLHKHKLVTHDAKKYDGYKLNYAGYDYLALKTFCLRNTVSGVGTQIGVGKESDIFSVINEDEEELCLKLHRLGRISFRAIKRKRDYLKHRKNASWMYMSRLAALKEYSFMKALYDHGFPVPTPIDHSRHAIVMSLVKGYSLCTVRHIEHVEEVYLKLMELIVRFSKHGLIHCDFNEFNIMIDNDENITVIDFPQMVSTSHPDAEMYFERDVNCIRVFFEKKFNYIGDYYPKFSDCQESDIELDVAVEASGFSKTHQKEFEELMRFHNIRNVEKKEEEEYDEYDEEEEEYEEEEEEEEEEKEEKNNNNNNENEKEEKEKEVNIEDLKKKILLNNRKENNYGDEEDEIYSIDNEEEEEEEEGEEEEYVNSKKVKKEYVTSFTKRKRKNRRKELSDYEIRNQVKRDIMKKKNKSRFKTNEYKSRDKRNLREVAKDTSFF